MHALPSRPWLASGPSVRTVAEEYDDKFPCSFEPKIILISMLAALLCLICFVLLYTQKCSCLVSRLGTPREATVTEVAPGSDTSAPRSYFNLFGRASPAVVGLPQQVINLLPSFVFGSIQQLVPHEKQQQQRLECPVCLSSYESDDLLRLLPRCRHAFHALCIDKWLTSTASCPLCRCLVSVNDVLNLQLVNTAPASVLEVIVGMDKTLEQEQSSGSSSSSSSCTKA